MTVFEGGKFTIHALDGRFNWQVSPAVLASMSQGITEVCWMMSAL